MHILCVKNYYDDKYESFGIERERASSVNEDGSGWIVREAYFFAIVSVMPLMQTPDIHLLTKGH